MTNGTMKKLPLALYLMSAVAAPSAMAADVRGTDLSALLEQAEFWEARNRPDLARESLEWAQTVQPDSERVLYRLGLASLSDDEAATRRWLQRLREIHPQSQGVAYLEQALAHQGLDRRQVEPIRELASRGDTEEAAQAYRALFAGSLPPPDLAQEYYQTLAGQENTWDEARQGLEQLVRLQPNKLSTRLALARTLSYRESTRRQAIDMLAGLDTQVPGLRAEWRQALLWLDASKADEALFARYVSVAPEDTEVAERFAEALAAKRVSPSDRARLAGYAALEQGRIDAAMASFLQAVRLEPRDAEAWGGLGIAKLRQHNYQSAEQNLHQAITLAPAQRTKWADALADAQFFQQIEQVELARDDGRLETAADMARRMAQGPARHVRTARLMEAEILLRQGQPAEAELLFRDVLASAPGDESALLGLYGSLQRQARHGEAQRLLADHPRLDPARLAEVRTVEALELSNRADRLRRDGDLDAAARLLGEAARLAPDNAWVRLARARHYASLDETEQARRQIAPLEQAADDPEAWHVASLFAVDERRWKDADALLGRIPATLRDAPDHRALAQRVAIGQRIDAALDSRGRGDRQATQEALSALRQLQPDDLASRGEIALALAQLGDAEGALVRVRSDLEEPAPEDAAGFLPHLSVLVMTGQLNEASSLMHSIERGSDLAPDGRQALRALRNGMVVAQADQMRNSGDLPGAEAALEASLAETPEDDLLLLALARVYEAKLRTHDAAGIYARVLQRSPDNPDALHGAVNIALANRDPEQAARLLADSGSVLDDRTSLFLSARVAEARGEYRRAIALLESARDAQQLPRPGLLPVNLPVEELLRHNLDRQDTRQPSAGAMPGLTPGMAGTTQASDLGRDIERMLDSLQERTATRLQAGLGIRKRSGDSGLSELTEISAPLQASLVPLEQGRLELSVTPVRLDAGRTRGGDARLYGSQALLANPEAAGRRSQDDSGVGLEVGYTTDAFSADLGSTPLGFEKTSVVGGLEWTTRVDDRSGLTFGLERRAVTDSLLAYAGARDPISGRSWGGVTRTGASLQYAWDNQTAGFYLGGGYNHYRGDGVENNSSTGVNAGVYTRPIRGPLHELQTGIAVSWMSYDKYQGGFTLGHGGYFSPSNFVAVSLPIQYSGRSDPWRLKAHIAPGYQSFRESSADFFPGDAALQAQLMAGNAIQARYASNKDSGLALGAGASLEYRLGNSARLGAALGYDSFGDFSERSALLYLAYSL
ncbi:cellulose biosynthesis protein BcsC [Stutzerimonas tarimensis]|uniref:Cellulose synthase subunit BcsC-related outer membrane protein n=1 Tax=Stutzerimonas tarimensis TaxID=1507735 RepID=A0ABV7T8R2_9GAMM